MRTAGIFLKDVCVPPRTCFQLENRFRHVSDSRSISRARRRIGTHNACIEGAGEEGANADTEPNCLIKSHDTRTPSPTAKPHLDVGTPSNITHLDSAE